MILEQAAAMSMTEVQGGPTTKRALMYLITKVALNNQAGVPMKNIITALLSIIVHSEGSHRIESAIRTAFDSIVDKYGTAVDGIILEVVTKFRTQGSLECKDKRITDIINKWYYKAYYTHYTRTFLCAKDRHYSRIVITSA